MRRTATEARCRVQTDRRLIRKRKAKAAKTLGQCVSQSLPPGLSSNGCRYSSVRVCQEGQGNAGRCTGELRAKSRTFQRSAESKVTVTLWMVSGQRIAGCGRRRRGHEEVLLAPSRLFPRRERLKVIRFGLTRPVWPAWEGELRKRARKGVNRGLERVAFPKLGKVKHHPILAPTTWPCLYSGLHLRDMRQQKPRRGASLSRLL